MQLIPPRFHFRVSHPCPFVAGMPLTEGDSLLELPDEARFDAFDDDGKRFADVRLAWNETGIGVTAEVTGKSQRALGDPNKPRSSDGLTLWLDTRGDRNSHRASRYCHMLHFLPAVGKDNHAPVFVQSAINRASGEAPAIDPAEVPIRADRVKGGYRLEAFLPAGVLNGFDPEEHPRLGVFYLVRDFELGTQTLGLTGDFPYHEDPSLWSVLELTKS